MKGPQCRLLVEEAKVTEWGGPSEIVKLEAGEARSFPA